MPATAHLQTARFIMKKFKLWKGGGLYSEVQAEHVLRELYGEGRGGGGKSCTERVGQGQVPVQWETSWVRMADWWTDTTENITLL